MDGDRVQSRRWWLAAVSGSVGLVGLLMFFGLGPADRLDTFDKLGSGGGLVVAVAALAVSVWSLTRPGHAPVVDPAVMLARTVDDLAERVAQQWRAELNTRGLGHLDPIRLRWTTTHRPVTPSPAELFGAERLPPVPARVTRLRLCGDVEDMVQALTQLPARQMVVIGSAGAGKSTLAMLLTLGCCSGASLARRCRCW